MQTPISLAKHRKSLAMAKAIAFYRRNSLATLKEVSAACQVSQRTAWAARQQMVIEGVCKPNRRAGKNLGDPEVEDELPDDAPGPEDAPREPNTLVDGEQLLLLAAGDTSELDDADPETKKRMLRELRLIAFNYSLHPDTRVTATKAWFALKDSISAKELGPGKPLTYADAVARLKDMNIACGLRMALDAIIQAFSLMAVLQAIESLVQRKDAPDEGQLPANTAEAPSSPSGTPSALGDTSPV